MKTYICTLGASIANPVVDASGNRMLPLMLRLNHPWGAGGDETRQFTQALNQHVEDLIRNGDKKRVEASSAEVTILSKLHVQGGDRVVLLATDTFIGEKCGAAVRRILEAKYSVSADNIVVRRIEGLQVSDAARAEKVGFGAFIDEVRKYIENARNDSDEIFLCPNGGYKGVVPFLTILGMLYRVRVVYTFEHVNSVINIPPLPFSLNGEYFRRAENALRLLTERVEMPEREYLEAIENFDESERDIFIGFVQCDDRGMVTPSSMLEHFVDAASRPYAMLSPKAVEDMKALEGTPRYEVFSRLIMDAQNPQMRVRMIDTYVLSDLIGVKRGRTAERLLGLYVGDMYYVARAVEHIEYDRLLKDGNAPKKADFPIGEFVRWEPKDVDSKSKWSLFDSMSRKIEVLETDALKMTEELEKTLEKADEKQEELTRLQKLFESVREDNQRLKVESSAKQEEWARSESALREELEGLRSSTSTFCGAMKLWYRSRFGKSSPHQ